MNRVLSPVLCWKRSDGSVGYTSRFSKVASGGTVKQMPRHSKARTPWRHVKCRRNRVVRAKQLSLHRMWHLRSNNSAFGGIITFRKTASRSFRYLSLSLQNGVLRSQGDTGVEALPTPKHDPIIAQMVFLVARLHYPAVLSPRRQSPAQNVEEVNRTQVLFKFRPQWGDLP